VTALAPPTDKSAVENCCPILDVEFELVDQLFLREKVLRLGFRRDTARPGTMPGDPKECRQHALRCAELAESADRPEPARVFRTKGGREA
jgi:hypothetical protein